MDTAAILDPATQVWIKLPTMARQRSDAAACVLPSGRVAVVGGGDETVCAMSTPHSLLKCLKYEWYQ